MTKTQIAHLIDAVLKHVPVPAVQEAAEALDVVLDTLTSPAEPVDVASWKDAIAAAKEPWQRIHDRAAEGVSDAAGTITTGVLVD